MTAPTYPYRISNTYSRVQTSLASQRPCWLKRVCQRVTNKYHWVLVTPEAPPPKKNLSPQEDSAVGMGYFLGIKNPVCSHEAASGNLIQGKSLAESRLSILVAIKPVQIYWSRSFLCNTVEWWVILCSRGTFITKMMIYKSLPYHKMFLVKIGLRQVISSSKPYMKTIS